MEDRIKELEDDVSKLRRIVLIQTAATVLMTTAMVIFSLLR